MDSWHLGISTDRRSIVKDDGSPFFWLGDTAWDLFVRLDREDAETYLRNRSEKGFTVIQAVAVMGYHIPFNTANVYGQRPFTDSDPEQVDLRGRDNYWTHVDHVVDAAARHGLYVGLLPTWGSFVCERDPSFTRETLTTYVSWIANRYKDRPNIIWVNGGDADLKFHDWADVPIWNAAGAAIRGSDPNHLITYHPRGGSSSSAQFHNQAWLDLNTYQSGHGSRYQRGDQMAACDWALSPIKPTLDSESCYEQHPINWTFENGNIDDHDVRRAAYGALMAGACGHTYGHVNLWVFNRPEEDVPELTSVEMPHHVHWKQAMDRPGAWQLQYAKKLFLSRPFLTRRPAQSVLLDTSHGQRALQGDGFLFAYSPLGHALEVDLAELPWSDHAFWWFDPRTGSAYGISVEVEDGRASISPPGTPYRGNDWVLVIDDAGLASGAPGVVKADF